MRADVPLAGGRQLRLERRARALAREEHAQPEDLGRSGCEGGLAFSTDEAAIVRALDHTEYRLGKLIARRARLSYSGYLRTLLSNLVARKIVVEGSDRAGVSVAPG